MTIFTAYQVPDRVASWVRASLRHGGAISQVVLRHGGLSRGVFGALLPPGVSADELVLDHGAFCGPNDGDSGLGRLLEDLASAAELGLVVEDPLSRSGDPALSRLHFDRGYLDDEVIHWGQVSAAAPELAVDLMGDGASGYPAHGFLLPAALAKGSYPTARPTRGGATGRPRRCRGSS